MAEVNNSISYKITDITNSISNIFNSLGNAKELIRENMKPLESINEVDEYRNEVNEESSELKGLCFKDIVTEHFLPKNQTKKVDDIKKEAAAIAAMAERQELEKIKKKKVDDYFVEMDSDIQQIKFLLTSKSKAKSKKKVKTRQLSCNKEEINRDQIFKKARLTLCNSVVSLSVIKGAVVDSAQEALNNQRNDDDDEEIICTSAVPVKLQAAQKVSYKADNKSQAPVIKKISLNQNINIQEVKETKQEPVNEFEEKRKKGKFLLDLKEINKNYINTAPIFTDEELDMLQNFNRLSDENKKRLKRKLFFYYKKKILQNISKDQNEIGSNIDDPDTFYASVIKQLLYNHTTPHVFFSEPFSKDNKEKKLKEKNERKETKESLERKERRESKEVKEKENFKSSIYSFGFGRSQSNASLLQQNFQSNSYNNKNCSILPANKNPFYLDTPKSFYSQNINSIYDFKNESLNLDKQFDSNQKFEKIDYYNPITEESNPETEEGRTARNKNYSIPSKEEFNVDLFLKKTLDKCNYENKQIAENTFNKYCMKNSSYLYYNNHTVEFTEKELDQISDVKALHNAHISNKSKIEKQYYNYERVNKINPIISSKKNSKSKEKNTDIIDSYNKTNDENTKKAMKNLEAKEIKILSGETIKVRNRVNDESTNYFPLSNSDTLKYILKTKETSNSSNTNIYKVNEFKVLSTKSKDTINKDEFVFKDYKDKTNEIKNKAVQFIMPIQEKLPQKSSNNEKNYSNNKRSEDFYEIQKKDLINPINSLNIDRIALNAKQEHLKLKLRFNL